MGLGLAYPTMGRTGVWSCIGLTGRHISRLPPGPNPDRPYRDEPRVIKRRKDTYRYMTRPREVLRQELEITRDTGYVHGVQV